jgi:glycosyltransferase involved in cell wall biosynthesis
VLHLITRLELGGAQQNTLFCTSSHDRVHFEVELISGAGGFLDDEALGIADARVQIVPWLRHRIAPMSDLNALFRLRRYFASQNIDLVHTHSSKAGIVGRLAAHLAGVPVIFHTVHGWSFNDTQPAIQRRTYTVLERLTARVTDRLIVVSARNREKGLALGIGRPEQYEVIHSGIDIEHFRRPQTDREQVRRTLGFGPDHRVVGTIACLKPQKAPLDFVRAAAAAHARDGSLRFFVAGDGELRGEMESLVDRLGLRSVVRLLGWRRDVVDLFHAMDVFLLPSLFEGLPRSVLQAMAAGVPVVATAVDGTPEVVLDRKTGLLVPPGRPEIAAERLLELTDDAELRRHCIEQAQSLLNRDFEIRDMVRRLDRLYLTRLESRISHGRAPAYTV